MRLVLSVIITVLLISCGTTKNMEEQSIEVSINKKWKLVNLTGSDAVEKYNVILDLSESNRAAGFIGCNRLMGSFALRGANSIQFNSLGSTRMACEDDIMRVENNVLKALKLTDNFIIRDGMLILNSIDNSSIATFKEVEDISIVNKNWKLTQFKDTAVKTSKKQSKEISFILKNDGSMSGFSGCNTFSGNYKLIDSNTISFDEKMITTLLCCSGLEIDENEFLTMFGLAENYTVKNGILNLRNKTGDTLAVFEAVYF